MNRVGDRALLLSPANSLYLFHIAQNRYTCLLSTPEKIDFFDFLDKADSSILIVSRNKRMRIVTQTGSIMQTIACKQKKMGAIEVQPIHGFFMVCFARHLEFFHKDAQGPKKWNLWKKMFTVAKEQIKTAKFTNKAR